MLELCRIEYQRKQNQKTLKWKLINQEIHSKKKKKLTLGFPSGPVVNNSTCNSGDNGSIAGQGPKTPHAAEHLRPGALQPSSPQLEADLTPATETYN